MTDRICMAAEGVAASRSVKRLRLVFVVDNHEVRLAICPWCGVRRPGLVPLDRVGGPGSAEWTASRNKSFGRLLLDRGERGEGQAAQGRAVDWTKRKAPDRPFSVELRLAQVQRCAQFLPECEPIRPDFCSERQESNTDRLPGGAAGEFVGCWSYTWCAWVQEHIA